MQDEDKNQQQAGWVFKPGSEPQPVSQAGASAPATDVRPDVVDSIVSWSASEYIANPKNTNWYALLAAATIALSVIVYFITSDIVPVVVFAVLGIVVGIFAARQPQILQYQLDRRGIHMGQRFYPYEAFKTFSVVAEGAFDHISLLPLKRFMPPISVHYSPDDEENIINTLAKYLPYEEHKRDLVESFSRRVRF